MDEGYRDNKTPSTIGAGSSDIIPGWEFFPNPDE